MRKLITPLFIMLLALTGCDNNDLLQSEDKVNSQINGRWKKVWGSSTEPYNEKWKFDNGSLTITREARSTDTTITTVDHGQYTVITKFSKCYITISGLTSETLEYWDLNRKWTIADVSGSVLYISTTNVGGAIISREFVKD
ncbi:MAG: hypothetical protein ABI772_03695 [Bacteroidota bacterium]